MANIQIRIRDGSKTTKQITFNIPNKIIDLFDSDEDIKALELSAFYINSNLSKLYEKKKKELES